MADIKAIDANALMTALHDVGGCDADPETWAAGYDAGIDLAIEMLKSQPAINPDDIRPQGRWSETNWASHDGHDEVITHYEINALKCSNCCCCFKKEALWRRYYCPNCGAKMTKGAGQ